MKRLLILIICLVLLASLALTLTRVLNTAHPVDPDSFAAMLNRDLQLMDGAWCWRKLCPGKTTAEQATVLLTGGVSTKNRYDPGPTVWRPYQNSPWSVQLYFADDAVLYFISLISDNLGQEFLPQVTMASIVAMAGEPTRIGINPDVRSVIYPCYAQGLCVRTVTWGRPQLRSLSPLDTVSLIEPQYVIAHLSKFPLRVGWQGFADYFTRP